MISWIMASIFSSLIAYIFGWDSYQMLVFTCLFAIFLQMCRKF